MTDKVIFQAKHCQTWTLMQSLADLYEKYGVWDNEIFEELQNRYKNLNHERNESLKREVKSC